MQVLKAARNWLADVNPLRKPAMMPKRDVDPMRAPKRRQSVPGFIMNASGYLPDLENNTSLSLRERWTTFSSNVRNTPILAACLQRREASLAGIAYRLEMPDDVPEEKESRAQELLDRMGELLFSMDVSESCLARHAVDIGSYEHNGFSLKEWERERPDSKGRVLLKNLWNVDPATIERFHTDIHGNVYRFVQVNPSAEPSADVLDNYYRHLRRSKFLYAVFRTDSGSPDGHGGLHMQVAEHCAAWHSYYLKQAVSYDQSMIGDPWVIGPFNEISAQVEAENPELDADGVKAEALARVQPLIDFATRTKKNDLSEARSVAVMDSDVYQSGGDNQTRINARKFDFGIVQGEHGPHADMREDRMEIAKSIARVFSCDDLFFGDTGGSGLSGGELADARQDDYQTSIKRLTATICDTYNRDLIKVFAKLNQNYLGLPMMRDEMGDYINVQESDWALLPCIKAEMPKNIDGKSKFEALKLEAEVRGLNGFDDSATHNAVRAEMGIPTLADEKIKEAEEATKQKQELAMKEVEYQDPAKKPMPASSQAKKPASGGK